VAAGKGESDLGFWEGEGEGEGKRGRLEGEGGLTLLRGEVI